MTPYGDIGLYQHWFMLWLVALWHQAIAWVNVDLLSIGFCGCHLTHWGQVTHICISKLTIGSDNGLSPGRRQAIIWTNVGILSIESLGTNISEILIKIRAFSFKKMHLKMSSGKWRPSCLGLNVLRHTSQEVIKLSSHKMISQGTKSQYPDTFFHTFLWQTLNQSACGFH